MSALRLRLGVDIGGTFTDLVIDGIPGEGLRLFKSSTTPSDPALGLLAVIDVAARRLGYERSEFLGMADQFVHGTTRATNAIVTGSTARTAFLCTEGHRDTLLWREGGGRRSPMDYTQPFPEPYVPRALTFEVRERMVSDGRVLTQLDEEKLRQTLVEIGKASVEAIAVCLLWSIANPAHELRVGELIREILPGIPFTLSHQLNPTIREYRRASSTAIDASLKPLMSHYFSHIEASLRREGFKGRLLVLTSAGGVLDATDVAQKPIHSVGSGPAAAPVAGRHFAALDMGADTAVVTDAGGTTYDVSLVRSGEIPWTRETMVGDFPGNMLGFPSVDVRSIGAGGGSIAWVDSGGLLRVGPQSAGADPGPAAYGRNGALPTVTDAAVVLGYIDPDYFLGGDMPLRADLAAAAIEKEIAGPLGISLNEAASAIFELACERMVSAIEEITLNQGIDPCSAAMIGGGGGAGLYSAFIARRLGVRQILIPETSAALSAAGALISDLRSDEASFLVTSSADFNFAAVNAVLEDLERRCEAFIVSAGGAREAASIRFVVEARYPHQNWEFEVPLTVTRFTSDEDVEAARQDFHAVHERLFAHRDEHSPVEFVTWRASVRCLLPHPQPRSAGARKEAGAAASTRMAVFGKEPMATSVWRLDDMLPGQSQHGPAIIETPATTIIVPPEAVAVRLKSGSLALDPSVSK